MSDTPRTDAEILKGLRNSPLQLVHADFARQLERELVATEACRLEELRHAEKLERELAQARYETAMKCAEICDEIPLGHSTAAGNRIRAYANAIKEGR